MEAKEQRSLSLFLVGNPDTVGGHGSGLKVSHLLSSVLFVKGWTVGREESYAVSWKKTPFPSFDAFGDPPGQKTVGLVEVELLVYAPQLSQPDNLIAENHVERRRQARLPRNLATSQ